MDMITDLPAVDQLTAAIMAVYDFYHAFIMEAYGSFMSEKLWSQVKQPFGFQQAAYLLTISSGFIDHNQDMTSWEMNYILLCKL